MNDMDDEDLSRFTDEDDDKVKPIDSEEEKPHRPRGMGTGFANMNPDADDEDKKEKSGAEKDKDEDRRKSGSTPEKAESNPAPEHPAPDAPPNPAPEFPGQDQTGDAASSPNPPPNPAPEFPEESGYPPPNPAPSLPGESEAAPAEDKPAFKSNEEFLAGDDDNLMPPSKAMPDPGLQSSLMITSVDNSIAINRSEQLDLVEKVPALRKITIGAGWDHKAFEEEAVDIDLSLFLLDKTDMTRIDEDFIFYNNERACDGAIQHKGDSRSGAGDGDDESILLDLNGIPFDIIKIVLVLSVYDPEIKGRHFGMVKNIFTRVINMDDNSEIMRYRVDPEDHKGGNAMIIGTLIREGPKWIFEADAEITHSGLAKFATDYGIIVKELQGTGEETWGEATESTKPPPPQDANRAEGEAGSKKESGSALDEDY